MRRKSDNELSVVCEYQLDRQRYSNLELLEAIVEDVYNLLGVLDSPYFSMLIAPDKHGTMAFLDWTEILFSLIWRSDAYNWFSLLSPPSRVEDLCVVLWCHGFR